MNILVKLPSRSRPTKLMETLRGYQALSNNKDKIHYLVTLDDDDASMTNAIEELKTMPDVTLNMGMSSNKVHAINRGISEYDNPWDILVLGSDDMICQVQGWDDILRTEMAEHFPDTDGVLWHNDGYKSNTLNTMCILGRAYYSRFNYIYHPEYKSLWADNEFGDVANILGKQKYFEQCLFRHVHPGNTNEAKSDSLYDHAGSFLHSDRVIYDKRKQVKFTG